MGWEEIRAFDRMAATPTHYGYCRSLARWLPKYDCVKDDLKNTAGNSYFTQSHNRPYNRRAMKKLPLLTFVVLVSFACAAQKQTDAQRLMTEALKPSPLQENLRVLTDEIGGRVPGTPAVDKAVHWGVDAFKAAGADDVKVESYSIAHAWQEGATRVAITSPAQFTLRA